MAPPSVVAVGTFDAANGGNITPALGSHQSGDILLLAFMQKDNVACSVTGWTEKVRYNHNSTHTLSLWWKRATSGAESDPTITHASGNSIVANTITVRGAIATGDPFDFVGANEQDTDEAYDVSMDPTVNDTLVGVVVGVGNDVQAGMGNYAGGGLTWTEQFSDGTNLGTDSAVSIGTAPYSGSHASFSPVTWDGTTGNITLVFGFAITPAPSGAEIDAQPGAYALTGLLAALIAARSLELVPGVFSITGAAATLASGRVVSADPGSYAVTGSAATLAAGYALSADPGSFAVTGVAADLMHAAAAAYEVDAQPGSFAVSGANATTAAGYAVDAQPGSYAVTGTDAELVHATPGAYTVNAEAGAYTVAGANATTTATRELSAAPAAFTVTGTIADVVAGRAINAATGSYAIAGSDAAILADRTLNVETGTYVITGFEAALGDIFHSEIDAQPGAFTVTGLAATLTFVPGQARLTTRGGRIRWNTTGGFRGENRAGRITQNKEGAVA